MNNLYSTRKCIYDSIEIYKSKLKYYDVRHETEIFETRNTGTRDAENIESEKRRKRSRNNWILMKYIINYEKH